MAVVFPHPIVFEDDFLLVVHKPCGLMVEPDRNGHPNLLHQVRQYLLPTQQTPYAQHLHRLDRPVSGLVLFTKNKEVLRPLSEQFAQRLVEKSYYALTEKAPSLSSGLLRHWHRKEKKKAALHVEPVEWAEEAILEYTVQPNDKNFLWTITLHTGKYHQIRAQLASQNCPIIGDSLYGSSAEYAPNAIALLAFRLAFTHPISGKRVELSCGQTL